MFPKCHQLFDPHCDWPFRRFGRSPPTCYILMIETRHNVGGLLRLFGEDRSQRGYPQGPRVRSDDGWPLLEMLPRAPDLRHCRALAVLHVLCPECHLPVKRWRCDGVVSPPSLLHQCLQWPPGPHVRHGRRRILIGKHAFLHHCRGFCAAGLAFSIAQCGNHRRCAVRGAVERAGACGSQVMEKCRDDPACTVSCRCLKESRDCQDDGARARGAALSRAIVDLLLLPIEEQAVGASRVFQQAKILSACRADCVPS